MRGCASEKWSMAGGGAVTGEFTNQNTRDLSCSRAPNAFCRTRMNIKIRARSAIRLTSEWPNETLKDSRVLFQCNR